MFGRKKEDVLPEPEPVPTAAEWFREAYPASTSDDDRVQIIKHLFAKLETDVERRNEAYAALRELVGDNIYELQADGLPMIDRLATLMLEKIICIDFPKYMQSRQSSDGSSKTRLANMWIFTLPMMHIRDIATMYKLRDMAIAELWFSVLLNKPLPAQTAYQTAKYLALKWLQRSLSRDELQYFLVQGCNETDETQIPWLVELQREISAL